jgi:hypothetical protein
MDNWQGIYSASTTNAILVPFSILSKNYKSYEEIGLIFGFSLKNWIIYSLSRIYSHNWGGEIDLKVKISALIFLENC